jgi:integrase/recombinase XerD
MICEKPGFSDSREEPMPYQYKREPLLPDEATRLAHACRSVREKLVIWTLLDTGLRVSELANLTPAQIDWQGHRLTIYGKGGPYGSQSKRRIIPLSARLHPLIAHHFALHDSVGLTPRAMQLLVKRVANYACINRPVTPHVLRHTFAVTAVQKGISLPALQYLLGHDRLTTTETYLNISPDEVVREFQQKW